jgi:Domain of unknown function (DUF4280)
MGAPVLNGAALACSMGIAPGTLVVLPTNRVRAEGQPMANVADHVAFTNITGFTMCNSLLNPVTAAQTSAALGTLTPGACTPQTMSPWTPAAKVVNVAGQPAIDAKSTCQCAYGGTITVSTPVATRESIG